MTPRSHVAFGLRASAYLEFAVALPNPPAGRGLRDCRRPRPSYSRTVSNGEDVLGPRVEELLVPTATDVRRATHVDQTSSSTKLRL